MKILGNLRFLLHVSKSRFEKAHESVSRPVSFHFVALRSTMIGRRFCIKARIIRILLRAVDPVNETQRKPDDPGSNPIGTTGAFPRTEAGFPDAAKRRVILCPARGHRSELTRAIWR
ncbi:hypothetical protein [Novosphingobium nitrogenifigens]|uniref:hypothetical protein n=1 Tax=Novosphingobium nitrogenifigens TaxID=378548 RepID=UPI0012F4CB2B|nr:hypothetical protein [Novosphingobium nitrogenifigens]